jgi:asparagine synthetase B (glutamine-hydrolysing)
LVGVAGYFLRNNGKIDLIERLLSECASPYIENEVVKISLAPSKSLGIVVPKGRALYDHIYDLVEQRGAITYGYILVGEKRVSAREVMSMDENEFYRTLEKADGSFLIVKVEKEKIWVATDWLSTRPAYYAIIDDGIVFSSCLWSILRFFKEMKYPVKLNDNAILSYLWLGRIGVLNYWTFIEGALLAPPGTVIEYDLRSGKLTFHKYYELQYKVEIKDKELAAKMIYYGLIKSVIKTLRILPHDMKKNLCVFLSGGLDSRVLAYYLSRLLGERIQAITFGTERTDEILIARKVTKELGIPHIVKTYDLNQLADYVHDLIRYSDGFDVASATHVVYAMKILIENNCHVFTDGFALDLTLGGSYLDNRLRKITDESEFSSYVFRKISVFNHKELMSIIGPRLRPQLLEVLKEFKSLIEQSSGDSYLNRNDYFFLYTRVRRFTVYGSVIERYSSDEILPTISRKFADVFTKIDPNLRMNHKIYRKFLLSLNKRLALIPYKSTWVPPLLPPMLWKTGFIIQRMNDLVKKLTNDRIGLEKTYFDFNRALRQKS